MVDPKKPVMLIWNVISHETGIYSGTLWLFAESTQGEKELILAKPMELKANTFLGFSYQSARLICIIGLIVGVILIFFPLINIKKPR